jgi:hypothetical protein
MEKQFESINAQVKKQDEVIKKLIEEIIPNIEEFIKKSKNLFVIKINFINYENYKDIQETNLILIHNKNNNSSQHFFIVECDQYNGNFFKDTKWNCINQDLTLNIDELKQYLKKALFNRN